MRALHKELTLNSTRRQLRTNRRVLVYSVPVNMNFK
jgi:hypothetical protein